MLPNKPLNQTFYPQKTRVLGLGLDYKLNSINFGIEINEYFKFLRPISFWVLKFLTFMKLLKKIFLNFLDPKNFYIC